MTWYLFKIIIICFSWTDLEHSGLVVFSFVFIEIWLLLFVFWDRLKDADRNFIVGSFLVCDGLLYCIHQPIKMSQRLGNSQWISWSLEFFNLSCEFQHSIFDQHARHLGFSVLVHPKTQERHKAKHCSGCRPAAIGAAAMVSFILGTFGQIC